MIINRIGNYIIQITDIENKKEKDELTLVEGKFKVNYIPSVNTLYGISDHGKYMLQEYLDERRKVWYHLQMSGFDRNCIPKESKITLEMGYYLKNAINSRDLDNLQKWTQDTIAEYFKFNDNRIYNLATYKRLIVNSDKELVHFRIKRFDYDENSLKVDNRLLENKKS